uniref:hypothetical protein n=1 Tax=uncultured Draconibacterium sp. TaxID=1573823 RepID=UPI00321717C3
MKKINYAVLLILAVLMMFAYSTEASIVVLNGLSHENQVQPGETYRGTIEIQNTGANSKQVQVYIKDYWFSFSGENRHDPGGTLKRSNANWISFNPELLTIDSSEVATINFEVKIPDDDTLRGTYWSVLMVEGITPPDVDNINQGVKINTAVRYAVQIISNVGTNAKSDLEFLGMELGKQENQNVLHVAIENVGECMLRPEMSLELFDESGNSVGIIKADRRKIFPGTSVLTTLVLEGIKPGNYTGVLIADCGEDRLFGSNLSIEVE